ncbi:putative CCR4-NOT transcription complex subunit 4 [Helianthus debilis subsp. tardiflorus]
MDFDGCDDSVLPQTVTGLFERKDLGHGSSWSFQNSDHSRFSFANENGHSNQELGRFSAFQDSREIQDSVYKPQYQGSRAQNVIPPGFSKPPPGFPSSLSSEQVVSATSDLYFIFGLVKYHEINTTLFAIILSGSYLKNSLPNNRYHLPSTGDLSNNGDDLIDPSMMVVGRGKLSIDTRSSSFDEEAKLWLLMQQQSASATHRHHEPQFSQTSFTQQHHTPQFPSSRDDRYGDITSRLVDRHHQSYAQQQQYSQPKFSNGHIINGYQQLHLDESQQVKYSPGYGELCTRCPVLAMYTPGYLECKVCTF